MPKSKPKSEAEPKPMLLYSVSNSNSIDIPIENPFSVYRGDGRAPSEIFPNGFKALGESLNVLDHVRELGEKSGYISTSTSKKVAATFPKHPNSSGGFLYEINRPRSGIEVAPHLINAVSEGKLHFEYAGIYLREREVAVPYKIPTGQIKGAWYTDSKHVFSETYVHNSNFTPTRILRTAGGVGLGLTAWGATVDGIRLYDSYHTGRFSQTAAQVVGGWSGAIAYGRVGAQVGFKIGRPFGPVGNAWGVVIGGVVGSTFGYWGGEAIIKSTVDMPFLPISDDFGVRMQELDFGLKPSSTHQEFPTLMRSVSTDKFSRWLTMSADGVAASSSLLLESGAAHVEESTQSILQTSTGKGLEYSFNIPGSPSIQEVSSSLQGSGQSSVLNDQALLEEAGVRLTGNAFQHDFKQERQAIEQHETAQQNIVHREALGNVFELMSRISNPWIRAAGSVGTAGLKISQSLESISRLRNKPNISPIVAAGHVANIGMALLGLLDSFSGANPTEALFGEMQIIKRQLQVVHEAVHTLGRTMDEGFSGVHSHLDQNMLHILHGLEQLTENLELYALLPVRESQARLEDGLDRLSFLTEHGFSEMALMPMYEKFERARQYIDRFSPDLPSSDAIVDISAGLLSIAKRTATSKLLTGAAEYEAGEGAADSGLHRARWFEKQVQARDKSLLLGYLEQAFKPFLSSRQSRVFNIEVWRHAVETYLQFQAVANPSMHYDQTGRNTRDLIAQGEACLQFLKELKNPVIFETIFKKMEVILNQLEKNFGYDADTHMLVDQKNCLSLESVLPEARILIAPYEQETYEQDDCPRSETRPFFSITDVFSDQELLDAVRKVTRIPREFVLACKAGLGEFKVTIHSSGTWQFNHKHGWSRITQIALGKFRGIEVSFMPKDKRYQSVVLYRPLQDVPVDYQITSFKPKPLAPLTHHRRGKGVYQFHDRHDTSWCDPDPGNPKHKEVLVRFFNTLVLTQTEPVIDTSSDFEHPLIQALLSEHAQVKVRQKRVEHIQHSNPLLHALIREQRLLEAMMSVNDLHVQQREAKSSQVDLRASEVWLNPFDEERAPGMPLPEPLLDIQAIKKNMLDLNKSIHTALEQPEKLSELEKDLRLSVLKIHQHELRRSQLPPQEPILIRRRDGHIAPADVVKIGDDRYFECLEEGEACFFPANAASDIEHAVSGDQGSFFVEPRSQASGSQERLDKPRVTPQGQDSAQSFEQETNTRTACGVADAAPPSSRRNLVVDKMSPGFFSGTWHQEPDEEVFCVREGGCLVLPNTCDIEITLTGEDLSCSHETTEFRGITAWDAAYTEACTEADKLAAVLEVCRALPDHTVREWEVETLDMLTHVAIDSTIAGGLPLLVRDIMLNEGYSQDAAEWGKCVATQAFGIYRVGRAIYEGASYFMALLPMALSDLTYYSLTLSKLASKETAALCSQAVSSTARYCSGAGFFDTIVGLTAGAFVSKLIGMGEQALADRYLVSGLKVKLEQFEKRYQTLLARCDSEMQKNLSCCISPLLTEMREMPSMKHYAQLDCLQSEVESRLACYPESEPSRETNTFMTTASNHL